jgi:hypothetical protein
MATGRGNVSLSNELPVVRVAAPWMSDCARPEADAPALPRVPRLEWLLARARRVEARSQAWREWLLEGSGLGAGACDRFPAGPCVHREWAGGAPAGTWACAAPVHLLTGIDHLQLAGPVPIPLQPDESAALLASINAHLAGTGFELLDVPGRGWLCRCPPGLDCVAVEPVDAIGRNLRDWLPSGSDAVRVRALVNEVQMLLHEHPVNLRRSAGHAPTVNSVWVWGFGTAAEARQGAPGPMLSDDDWLSGLWRLNDGTVGSHAELAEVLRGRPAVVRIALAPTSTAGAAASRLEAAEHAVFAPLQAAVRAGRVGRMAILGGQSVFEVTAAARFRFWRVPRPLGEVLA